MENNVIYDKEQLEQMGVTRGETAGKINMMGINIDLSKTMGNMLAEQYIAQLSSEDMQRLMDFISNDLFTKQSRYDYTEGISKEIKVITEGKKNSWGNVTEPSIGEMIKNRFNERIKEELIKKVEEIVTSTDYQERIDKIANDLVEYSITGYANDMKERIRERLVGNTINSTPYYDGRDLRCIIHECINERLGN